MATRTVSGGYLGLVGAAIAALLATAALAVATTTPADAADRRFTLPAGVLGELSGMATSLKHPGVVYANNDSGNTNEIFAIDSATGALRARLNVTGTTNTDWEGLAVGRDTEGRPAVFVGDIGGNFGRTTVLVHRFVEPDVLADGAVQPTTFQLTYPGGLSTDAESLLVDQTSGQLYVASKVALPGTGRLFRAPLPLASGTLVDTGRSVLGWATDGAFAPSGRSYTVRSGGPFGIGPDVAHVYDNATGTRIAEVPLPAQPQGEAVAYLDCRTLLVGSEGDPQVWSVPLPPEAMPPGSCDGGGTTTTSPTTSSTSTSTSSSTSTSTSTTSSTSTSTSTSTTTSTTQPPTQGPVVANPGNQRSRFLQPVSLRLGVTGGTPPTTCTATGLPATLWMDSASCTVVGWPTRIGEFTATDSAGRSGRTTFTWSVVWF